MLHNFDQQYLEQHIRDLRTRELKSFNFTVGSEFGGKKNHF